MLSLVPPTPVAAHVSVREHDLLHVMAMVSIGKKLINYRIWLSQFYKPTNLFRLTSETCGVSY